MSRWNSNSNSSPLFGNKRFYQLIELKLLLCHTLIIIAHTELYIDIHTLAETIFLKHDFNYNCEIMKLCFENMISQL